MDNVTYLLGESKPAVRPLPPYSEVVGAFCHRLSQELLADPRLRTYPDVTALAFWCRRSNFQQMQQRFEAGNPPEERRLGRGMAFHVAPGNIPVNFAYSFLFSLLAGNGNIVRVPSRPFPQTYIIIDAIRRVLEGTSFVQLRDSMSFVSYPSSDAETTATFSAMADARLIWGGDATIRALRKMPVKPNCTDLCFADRYSVAVIDGCAVLDADDALLLRQIEGFYNDTYLMDQNACSSPQIIFWLNATEKAKDRFWNAAARLACERYPVQAASSMDKYVQLCRDAIMMPDIGAHRMVGSYLTVLTMKSLPQDTTVLRGRCGYFYEFGLDELSQIAHYISSKYQTITCFGVDPKAVQKVVTDHRLTGIDRIVPFGKAMDIGVIWDGYDVVRCLSRVIALV